MMPAYWKYKLSKAATPVVLASIFAGVTIPAFLNTNDPDATILAQKIDITCTRKDGKNVRYEGYVQPKKSFSTIEASSSIITTAQSYTLIQEHKNVASYPVNACEILYHPEDNVLRSRYSHGVVEIKP